MLNVPIIEDVLLSRLNLSILRRDGYTKNRFNGKKFDDDDLTGVTPQIRFMPMKSLTIDVKGHWAQRDMKQRGGKCVVVDPANSLVALFSDANMKLGPVNPDYHATCNADANAGFYEFSTQMDGDYKLTTYGITGTIDFDTPTWWIFENSNLKNITGWMEQEDPGLAGVDFDFTSDKFLEFASYEQHEIRNISEELTWTATTTLGQMLPFLPEAMHSGLVYPTLGVYFSWEESEKGLYDNHSFGAGDPLYIAFEFMPNAYIPIDITASALPVTTSSHPEIENKTQAIYSQWTFETHDLVHFTGGLRYTREHRKLRRFAPGLNQTKASRRFDNLSYLGNVKFNAPDSWLQMMRAETANLFYTYSTGYKSGGFNDTTDPVSGLDLPPFDSETLASHEVGLKFNFFNNRATLNFAMFHNTYDDIQLTVTRVKGTVAGTAILNAGSGTVKGIELELWLNPFPDMAIDFSIGLQDPKYKEFDDIMAGTGAPIDRSNEPFPHVSKTSIHLGVQYAWQLQGLIAGHNWGTLTPRWDFIWDSKKSYSLSRIGYQSGLFEQDPVALHNFRLSWQSPEAAFHASFWIKNAFSKKYINGAIDNTAFLGTGSTRAAPPRMYGVQFGYAF
jgi:outer membrane receptor protein involved in Fe transport